jgi:hypothetical protein
VARAEATGSADANAGAKGGGAMTLPEQNRRARAYAGDSDHDAVVGTLAVGYLGRRSMLIAEDPASPTGTAIDAPVIGVRYWFTPLLGLDVGLGMAINGTGLTTPAGDQPAADTSAFILHGGVPLALAASQHFVFEIIPEMNIGFSSWGNDAPGPAKLTASGFHLDIGARAGAEIHFGFIGLPKLSLQGTIGLVFATDSTSFEDATGATVKRSYTTFGTTVHDSPWNIFTSNVAALYYF